MQLKNLDITTRNYINELELKIKLLQNTYETQIKNMENDYQILKEKYDLVIYKRFAQSAEKLLADKKQQMLFNSEPAITIQKQIKQEEFEEVKSFIRKKKGRKPLDPKLHREQRIIDIPDSEKICACGCNLTRIGEESNEKLHIIPPRIYVEKTIRPKYACRKCEGTEDEGKKTVRIAPVEPSIIPKSIVSASLLSTIIIQKFVDHLPYYRQEKQFERIMVVISRQDMSNWQQQAYSKLKPLIELLKEVLNTLRRSFF